MSASGNPRAAVKSCAPDPSLGAGRPAGWVEATTNGWIEPSARPTTTMKRKMRKAPGARVGRFDPSVDVVPE